MLANLFVAHGPPEHNISADRPEFVAINVSAGSCAQVEQRRVNIATQVARVALDGRLSGRRGCGGTIG